MRLSKVKSSSTVAWSVVCRRCQRNVPNSDLYWDCDAAPFKHYYCGPCSVDPTGPPPVCPEPTAAPAVSAQQAPAPVVERPLAASWELPAVDTF